MRYRYLATFNLDELLVFESMEEVSVLKRQSVTAALIAAVAVPIALCASAHADAGSDAIGPLADSTHAMFVGGTFEPTPSTAWVDAAYTNFLQPLGFAVGDGASNICDMTGTAACDAPLQVLTTPELLEEGPSTAATSADIVSAVEAEYAAGNMSATDPLTVFTYSQSAMAMSDAEARLSAAGIPEADLHLVMIGDGNTTAGVATNIYTDLEQLLGGGTSAADIAAGQDSTDALLYFVNEGQFAPAGTMYDGHILNGAGTENGVTPNDFYPTTIYTINTDGIADWQGDWNAALAQDNGSTGAALGSGIYNFLTTHLEYLGLTPAEVSAGTSTVDGLTTTVLIPDPTDWASAWATGLGDIMSSGGFWQSIAQSLQDVFNPAWG